MNWFTRIAQYTDQVLQQYQSLPTQLGSVSIIGSGANESLNVGGKTINVRDVLNQAVSRLQSVLKEKGVNTIDTSGLSPQNQGLAVSSEPGKIHVDVKKITDQFRNALPPNVQTDGSTMDNDIEQNIVNKIMAEIGGTISHESQHMSDYRNVFNQWQTNPNAQGPAFNTVQEAPGPRFEEEAKRRYFNQ